MESGVGAHLGGRVGKFTSPSLKPWFLLTWAVVDFITRYNRLVNSQAVLKDRTRK